MRPAGRTAKFMTPTTVLLAQTLIAGKRPKNKITKTATFCGFACLVEVPLVCYLFLGHRGIILRNSAGIWRSSLKMSVVADYAANHRHLSVDELSFQPGIRPTKTSRTAKLLKGIALQCGQSAIRAQRSDHPPLACAAPGVPSCPMKRQLGSAMRSCDVAPAAFIQLCCWWQVHRYMCGPAVNLRDRPA